MNEGRAILLAMTAISIGMAIVVYTFPGMLRAMSTAGTSDCADCPQMVLIPAGEFTMGSPGSELLRGLETQHRVTIPSFALGKYEVTFAQWDACVADGGCDGPAPDDEGWGRGTRPLIGVTWDEAKSYVEWLSKKRESHIAYRRKPNGNMPRAPEPRRHFPLERQSPPSRRTTTAAPAMGTALPA